jgi:hypothetical protein
VLVSLTAVSMDLKKGESTVLRGSPRAKMNSAMALSAFWLWMLAAVVASRPVLGSLGLTPSSSAAVSLLVASAVAAAAAAAARSAALSWSLFFSAAFAAASRLACLYRAIRSCPWASLAPSFGPGQCLSKCSHHLAAFVVFLAPHSLHWEGLLPLALCSNLVTYELYTGSGGAGMVLPVLPGLLQVLLSLLNIHSQKVALQHAGNARNMRVVCGQARSNVLCACGVHVRARVHAGRTRVRRRARPRRQGRAGASGGRRSSGRKRAAATRQPRSLHNIMPTAKYSFIYSFIHPFTHIQI